MGAQRWEAAYHCTVVSYHSQLSSAYDVTITLRCVLVWICAVLSRTEIVLWMKYALSFDRALAIFSQEEEKEWNFTYPRYETLINLIQFRWNSRCCTTQMASWSWNSSTNYFMARALRVRFHHNTHESYVCRAKCRVCGAVKSELGQWIRINIGRARLKRNFDLIIASSIVIVRAHSSWLRASNLA